MELNEKQIEFYWKAGKVRNTVLFLGVVVGIVVYAAVITSLLMFIPDGVDQILGVHR